MDRIMNKQRRKSNLGKRIRLVQGSPRPEPVFAVRLPRGLGRPLSRGLGHPRSGGLGHPPRSGGLGHPPRSGGLGHPRSGGLGHPPRSGGLGHPCSGGLGHSRSGGLGRPPSATETQSNSEGQEINSAQLAKKRLFLPSPQDKSPFDKSQEAISTCNNSSDTSSNHSHPIVSNWSLNETGVAVLSTPSPNTSSIRESNSSCDKVMRPLASSQLNHHIFSNQDGFKPPSEYQRLPLSQKKSATESLEVRLNNGELFSTKLYSFRIERPKTPIFLSDQSHSINVLENKESEHALPSLKKSPIKSTSKPLNLPIIIQDSSLSKSDLVNVPGSITDERPQLTKLPKIIESPGIETRNILNTTDEFLLEEMTMVEENKTIIVSPHFKEPQAISKPLPHSEGLNLETETDSDSDIELLSRALSKLNTIKVDLENTTNLVNSLLKKRTRRKTEDVGNKENCPMTSSKNVKEKWMSELKCKNPALLKTPKPSKQRQTLTWTPHSLSTVLTDQMNDLFE